MRVDENTLPPAYGTTTNQNPFDLTLSNGPPIVAVNFGYASIYAVDRLTVGTFAPCTDYTWLQTLAAAYSATITTADTDACLFTLAATPTNLTALRAALASHPNVRHDQPDVWGYGTYSPGDPDYNNVSLVYGPQQINAPTAWDSTLGNPALILAVIDTGIDFAHPEFAGRILPGYDFVNKDANPADDNGHGTHVAGIAAAGINNALGMAGIAGTVKILPVKVLNASNVGWMADVAAGITYAVDQGARVINLSLAGSAASLSVRDAIAYAVSKGVVVVAAAGNDNTSANRYPAVYDTVVAVGATDYNNVRWSLSNFGPNVDVMAPGASVWSTRPGNTYAFMSGTSMAAPHAAGVAALILSVNPNLTSAEVKQALQDTAVDMGDPGYDSMHGYGRINAGAAVASIPPAAAIPPTTSLETELLVDLNNNGLLDPGDTLGYTIVAANSGPTSLTNVVISATVPAYTTYVPGSTQLNAIPVLDGGGSFPLDEGGLNIGSVPANNSSRVSFRVVVGTLPRGVYTIFATATVQSALGKATIVAEREVAGSLLKASVDKATARSGDSLLYTVTTDYVGSALLQSVVITAAIPTGTSYVGDSDTPEAISEPGGGAGMLTWNLGSNTAGLSWTVAPVVGSAIVTAIKDTFIDVSGPTKNNGSTAVTELKIRRKSDGSTDLRPLLQWDLSSLPAGAMISAATIQFGVTRADAANEVVGVYQLNTAWVEGTQSNATCTTGASWNDPDCSTSSGLAWTGGGESAYNTTAVGTFNTNATGYQSVTGAAVVALVQSWANNTSANNGVILKGTSNLDKDVRIGSLNNAGNEPKLIITYYIPGRGNAITASPTLVSTGGQIQISMVLTQSQQVGSSGTVDVRVAASSDDVEEFGPEVASPYTFGQTYIISSDIEMVEDFEPPSSGTQKVGMRFTGITVPQGATITNAYIRFRAIAPDSPSTNNNTANLTVRGEAADNATTFTAATNNLSNRITTTASLAWLPPAWTTGTNYDTPDIKTVVQEIVNRSGWANNNSMVFIITGSGSRSADSYDGSPTTAPLLHIDYTAPGSYPTTPVTPSLIVTGTNGATASLVSGPTPASAVVTGTGTLFTWSYQANANGNIGTLLFGGSATDGSKSWAQTISNSVLVAPPLTFRATVNTPPAVAQVQTTAFITDTANRLPSHASNTPTTQLPASVGDRVWNDQDGDAIQDPGEPGISGVTVRLTRSDSSVLTAVTNSNGDYDFTNLASGSYTATVDVASIPALYKFITTPELVALALNNGQDYNAADFGLKAQSSSIGDTIWYDADGDGRQDVGEPGLGNISLDFYLDDGDGVFEPVPSLGSDTFVGSTISNAAGAYRMDLPVDGGYFVDVTDQRGLLAGLAHTVGVQSATDPSPLIPVVAGQYAQSVDFGYVRLPAAGRAILGDKAWVDENSDGLRQIAEPVVIDTQICATPSAGGAAVCAQTDVNGRYLLELPAGGYTVAPTSLPLGLSVTTPSPLAVVLAAGGQYLNTDFGFGPNATTLGTISGQIWQDIPVNEVVDGFYTAGTEPGLPNVSVDIIVDINQDGLWDSGDVYVAALSDLGGIFQFRGLLTNSYLVRVSDTLAVLRRFAPTVAAITGSTPTDNTNKSQPFAIDLAAGETNSLADFGYREYEVFGTGSALQPGIIGDQIWLDVNGNSIYEPTAGDRPIPGVTLEARNGGVVISTATTGSDGKYLLMDLPLGQTYDVRVTDLFGVLAFYQPIALGTPGQDNHNQAQPYAVTLGLVSSNTTADFGYMPAGSQISLTQQLLTPGPVRSGEPIVFSIRITNTGSTVITGLPLQDSFDSAFLSYVTASIGPDSGAARMPLDQLVWNDLTGAAGELAAGATLEVQITFSTREDTSSQPGSVTVNTASVSGVSADADGTAGSAPLFQPLLPNQSSAASIWVIVPTAVQAVVGQARVTDAGVELSWQTTSEVELTGFNLTRTDGDGLVTRLNPTLIPAQAAGQATGAAYTWLDASGSDNQNAEYTLEIVGLDGSVRLLTLGRALGSYQIFLPLSMKP